MASQHRIKESLQCKAIAKNGHRCKKRTCRSEYCWIHLASIEDLRIKKSQIRDGGLGLFCGPKPIKADKKICDYKGKIINSNAPVTGPYVLQLGPTRYVDAAQSRFVGGFSNMARAKDAPLRNNAKLTAYNGEGRIKSTKNITPGKEILTSYGRDYFR